jgi:hypothetical protein
MHRPGYQATNCLYCLADLTYCIFAVGVFVVHESLAVACIYVA